MLPTIRLLPPAAADGATNMAADEAMLESAADRGLASLRFYTWHEPTLSLGYFQPSAGRLLPNLSRLAWVRRSTGGAGIVHHHELTYSFALPAGREWKSAESWICRVHRLVRDVLAECGVVSKLVVCGEERKIGDVLCFLHHTPGDLVMGEPIPSLRGIGRDSPGETIPSLRGIGRDSPNGEPIPSLRGIGRDSPNGESKVAGSAQRKMRGALLQHGSLLLRQSEFAPELPGMCDLAGRELFAPLELVTVLKAKFAEEMRAIIEPGEWTPEELARIPFIRAEKYGTAEWNERR